MEEKIDYPVEKRFGNIVKDELWGIVPYALYKYQSKFDLSNSEVWFLTWLFMHQWNEDDSFPSISALSRYSGRCRPYIQRIIKGLVAKEILEKNERRLETGARGSNYYNFDMLIKKLEEEIKKDNNSMFNKNKQKSRPAVAKEAVEERE